MQGGGEKSSGRTFTEVVCSFDLCNDETDRDELDWSADRTSSGIFLLDFLTPHSSSMVAKEQMMTMRLDEKTKVR